MLNFRDILGCQPIHPFPARMAPSLVWEALPDEPGAPMVVADPMCGSGTVTVVSRFRGHQAIGVDADPLAVLLARAWCHDVNRDAVRSAAKVVLGRGKTAFSRLAARNAYPDGADEETKQFSRYWFDQRNRRQLVCLSRRIRDVDDTPTRDLLWVGFSRMVIAKSRGVSLAMDLSHSRPHRVFEHAPVEAFDEFLPAVNKVLQNMPFDGGCEFPPAQIALGDARSLDLRDETVDLVMTSPPYSNAIDYIRCSKFSLIWMGHDIPALRAVRSESIGTEAGIPQQVCKEADHTVEQMLGGAQLPSSHVRMLRRYVADLQTVMTETVRVLKPGGRAVIVIGDCTMRGVFVRNSLAVEQAGARAGLTLGSRTVRDLPPARRYLPPPCSTGAVGTLAKRMREEVVITLRKAA